MTEPVDEGPAPEQLPPESPAHDQLQAEDNAGLSLVRVAASSGFRPTPLSGTIQGLLDAGVRGQSGMALLQVLTAQLEADLLAAREELAALRRDLKETEVRFYDERLKVGVLRERARSTGKGRWLQSGALTLGGVIGGIAVPHLNDQHAGLAIGATLAAALLLCIGWIPLTSKGEE